MQSLPLGQSPLSHNVAKIAATRRRGEEGLAVLIAVIALSVFSLLGLYLSLNATTEVRISDNFESKLQADYAARAGISHVRELLRGLQHNDLLKGPDGNYNNSTGYLAQARTFGFRNWLSWQTGRSLDILDPTSAVSGIPDDGLVNTGKFGGTNGTVLIPSTGVALMAPNPYGSGTITTSRYFVKISDNNSEPSETTVDAADNPFVDGDGIILARSMGVARTIREAGGGVIRANSVSVYEMRFKRSTTFKLDSPVVLQGDSIVPSAPSMFNGNAFRIDGGQNAYGIGTIDPDLSNGTPVNQITGQLDPNQRNNIQGQGGNPSVSDLTTSLSGDQLNLLDAGWLWSFVQYDVPTFADYVYQADQTWSGGSAPYMGYYDLTKPSTDPVQDPKVTYVNGDLSLSGNLEGAGILVVTGKISGSGSLNWNGLILVIGEGDADFSGMNVGITGGLYVVNVQPDASGTPQFGTTKFTMSGNSDIVANSNTIEMATSTIPARQLSLREITSLSDP